MATLSRNARTSPRPAQAPWVWAFAGLLLGGMLAVLLFAPAHWLAAGVRQATSGQVELADPRGTVWQGTAQLVFTGGAGSKDATALPGRTAWQLRPHWDGLRASIEAACCTRQPLQVAIQPHWGGARLQVANSQTQWPAALLTGLGTPWNTVQAQGELTLATDNLAFDWAQGRLVSSGKAELKAMQVSSRLSTLQPMGSYRLAFTGGATPALQLDTLDGALQLQGQGHWVGSRLRFTGEASAAPDREAALSNLLNIIGRRHGARSIITVG